MRVGLIGCNKSSAILETYPRAPRVVIQAAMRMSRKSSTTTLWYAPGSTVFPAVATSRDKNGPLSP
eukprot:1182410-Prorocentrum_minimum.AAC.5